MNKNAVRLAVAVGTLAGIASGLAQAPTLESTATGTVAVPSGPRIQFAETTFDFGKIDSGQVVKHEFVFTNTGSATLEIKEVQPGCGCTTTGTWDKSVAPGKTGIIPLQFNSTSFSGSLAKSATVVCSDPAQSNVVLHLKGTVWKAIDVIPSLAVFAASTEIQTNETRVLRIVSNLEEPLELSDLQCTNRSFLTELNTLKPGKEFELRITAVPPFAATRIDGVVTLKTSSTKMPAINVSASVTVQPPVTVIPNYIMLPPGPLTNAIQRVLRIENSGTNALVLSEPRTTVPGAKVVVKEVQPGRQFKLIVEVPAGFQAELGRDLEVTVKSNHPKFPLLSVHVFQPQPQPPRSAAVQTHQSATEVAPGLKHLPAPLVVPARPAPSVARGR